MSGSAPPGSEDSRDPGVVGEPAEPLQAEPWVEAEGSPPSARRHLPPGVKVALALVLLAVAGGGVLAYRRHQEHRIVALSVARAEQLVRSDTWLGYHEAAALLGVRATRLDPIGAGALRAFALAMLATDYRDEAAVTSANAALVEPLRAPSAPAYAYLAVSALALRDGQAGTALDYASRAGDAPLAKLLEARVAVLAGKPSVASESVQRALEIAPEQPAALALHGDLLRRAGKSGPARGAYLAAIAISSRAVNAGMAGSQARAGASAPHARATFGLAKLALSREAPADEAMAALGRLLDDRAGTPQVERARAAMYLAALEGRAGDRAAEAATIDKASLDGELRAWVERAAGQLEVERGPYRVPDNTPPPLQSASDDDPYVAPPPPPPRQEPPPPRQVLSGFKVAPAPKRAKHTGAKKSPAPRRPRASGQGG